MRPPGSKSHTIRAVFAAAAAAGESMIVGPLESDDTIRARECLTALGARYADRDGSWSVSGVNGEFSAPSGSLDAGESGLTSRFLLALTPFIPSPVVIQGRGRLPERPMEGLLDNLEQRGAQVERGYPWRIDASGAARSGTFAV
ncbi:MAG: 3-phosphoshikimate 1-carboxyvinyltransferase, partial [Acidimicrobiia bacterium]